MAKHQGKKPNLDIDSKKIRDYMSKLETQDVTTKATTSKVQTNQHQIDSLIEYA